MKEQLSSVCRYTDDKDLREFMVGSPLFFSDRFCFPAAVSKFVMIPGEGAVGTGFSSRGGAAGRGFHQGDGGVGLAARVPPLHENQLTKVVRFKLFI